MTTSSTFGYLTQCAFELIAKNTENGYFVPILPLEDIFAFLITSYDGLIRDITLTRCYPDNAAPEGVPFDEKKLIHCLYISIMTLLGKAPQCWNGD